jgi:hypothetical protein
MDRPSSASSPDWTRDSWWPNGTISLDRKFWWLLSSNFYYSYLLIFICISQKHINSFLLFLLVFVVLRSKSMALHMLGKHSATEIHPSTYWFFFFFFLMTRVWTQGSHLSHSTSPYFCVGCFWNSASLFSPDCPQTVILLISASQVARITDMSHQHMVPYSFLI